MIHLDDMRARDVVAHLDPGRWARANRLVVGKALGEFSHERLLEPRRGPDGGYTVTSDDGAVTYRFEAELLALDHWQIDGATITRRRSESELALDALDLVLELRETLGLDGERLGLYMEELSSTLSALAFKLAAAPMSAAELARADFQTIEARMTEGHPCFVANSGRLGFDAADYLRYAPEAASPVRLTWVAAHRDLSTFSTCEDIDYDRLLEHELGDATMRRFADAMSELGLDLGDYHLIPTHPWQWLTRLSVTFAADVARRRLVCLGYGDDEYLAQQSIRTFFNASDPSKHYVKTALSVVNMGFVRGLSAAYMEGTPAINDWVADLVAADDVLQKVGFAVVRERAAVGYRSEHYEDAAIAFSPYSRMLAALWRESPVGTLLPGERLATMASLLHVDEDGRSFAGVLIERSGLEPEAWLGRYLDAYLRPLLHCFYAHQLVFMPHGENIILVLEDDVPRRVILKDIGEEVVLMDPDTVLPEAVERIRADVPDNLRVLSIFTDVFDCFLRFLNAILVKEGTIAADGLWAAAAACVRDYQRSAPHLAERFAQHDLFAERFDLSCLNRLQLRDSRQMVDLQDPVGSLQFAGTLANPLAGFAGGGARANGVANGRRPTAARPFPLCVGILEVVEARQLSPNMRRVVLTGDDVAELPVEQPGEMITLIWPAPGSDEIVLPARGRWRFPEGGRKQPARNLTIRSLDRAQGRITVDFFLHDEDGPAAGWGRSAAPGDTVGYGGPRAHWVTDPGADWTLLVGDETALPAIAAIVEQRPAAHRTIAVVEIADAAEQQTLDGPDDIEIHWLHRGERAPGPGSGLVAAVAALELPARGRAQVWAAGESLLMRRLREHLRDDRRLPRECLNVLGYWKHTA